MSNLQINRGLPTIGLLLGILITACVIVGTAIANPSRVTKGDAVAVLGGFATGGRAIFLHRGFVNGGPADGLLASRAAIRPFPLFEARHYCEVDWHVILLSLFDGGDRSYTREDAVETLSPTRMEFTLDSETLRTDRQSIRRFLYSEQYGLDEAFGYTQGTIMSPADLGPGLHTLAVRLSEPDFSDDLLTITFFVDAAETGIFVQ